MELRMILYGYRKEQFDYFVEPEEAKIVRSVYEKYISGESLLSIANQLTKAGVIYYKDRCEWSKQAVRRILENEKYVGNDEYPAIVDKDVFEQAMEIRLNKGGTREKDSKEVAYVKAHSVCGQCGSRYSRKSKYKFRERWLCTNNCPNTKEYLDDEVYFRKIQSVLDAVIKNPDLLRCEQPQEEICFSEEYLEKEKQLKRMIDGPNPMFQPIKKLLFEIVSEKFNFLKLDSSKEVTDELCAFVSEYTPSKKKLDIAFMEKTVSKIIVYKPGNIGVQFINGAEIGNEQVIDNE